MIKRRSPSVKTPRKKNQDVRDFAQRYNVTIAEVWRFRHCKYNQIGPVLAAQLAAEHRISYGHISDVLWVVKCLRSNGLVARAVAKAKLRTRRQLAVQS